MKSKFWISLPIAVCLGCAVWAVLSHDGSGDRRAIAARSTGSDTIEHALDTGLVQSRLIERLSVPTTDTAPTAAQLERLVEELERACLTMEPNELETLVSRWLVEAPYPAEGALVLFDRLGDAPESARAAGLLLQACMLFADQLPADGLPWTRATLAQEILARSDVGPLAAMVVRKSLAPFAADIPPAELTAFIGHTGSGELLFGEQASMLQRMFLINELAAGMAPEVADLLAEQVASPTPTDRSRFLAAGALMHRDWRDGAERLRELLANPDVELSKACKTELHAALGGGYVELHGRDRLELLREIVDDPSVSRMALCSLTPDQAMELDLMATQADRDWQDFGWVELALGGERGFRAGLELVDRLDSGSDNFYAAQVLGDLLSTHAGDPELAARLDQRFSRRSEASDPYWGALAAVAHRLDEVAVYQEILPRLQDSYGEPSESRGYVLRTLDSRFPGLGLSSF